MRAGRRRKGKMAVAGGIQADVLAQGRRRSPRCGSSAAARLLSARAPPPTAKHDIRSCSVIGRPAAALPPAGAAPGFADARAAAALAWRDAIFLCVWLEEAIIMARHRGRGIASINYPIGMNLGGDPSQAL